MPINVYTRRPIGSVAYQFAFLAFFDDELGPFDPRTRIACRGCSRSAVDGMPDIPLAMHFTIHAARCLYDVERWLIMSSTSQDAYNRPACRGCALALLVVCDLSGWLFDLCRCHGRVVTRDGVRGQVCKSAPELSRLASGQLHGSQVYPPDCPRNFPGCPSARPTIFFAWARTAHQVGLFTLDIRPCWRGLIAKRIPSELYRGLILDVEYFIALLTCR